MASSGIRKTQARLCAHGVAITGAQHRIMSQGIGSQEIEFGVLLGVGPHVLECCSMLPYGWESSRRRGRLWGILWIDCMHNCMHVHAACIPNSNARKCKFESFTIELYLAISEWDWDNSGEPGPLVVPCGDPLC